MKYADLNTDGTVKGFYSDDVHDTIPQGAIEISDADWMTYLENQSTSKFINGVLTSYVPEPVIVNITSITKVQAMRQLKALNLWTQFQAMLSSNQDANDEWMLALNLDINDPFVQSLAPTLKITTDELQELFNEASKL